MSECKVELLSTHGKKSKQTARQRRQADVGDSTNNLAQRIRKKHSMFVRIVEIGKQCVGNNELMRTKLVEASTVHRQAIRELLLIGRELHKKRADWKKWLNHQCLMSENVASHYMK